MDCGVLRFAESRMGSEEYFKYWDDLNWPHEWVKVFMGYNFHCTIKMSVPVPCVGSTRSTAVCQQDRESFCRSMYPSGALIDAGCSGSKVCLDKTDSYPLLRKPDRNYMAMPSPASQCQSELYRLDCT